MIKYKYKIGDKVIVPNGQLEYLSKTEEKSGSRYYYKWKCYCGKEFLTLNKSIAKGYTKSCGCWKKQIIKNKLKDPNIMYLRSIWNDIKTRCYNKKRKAYKNYGARGIIIDEIWKNDSSKFIEDIISTIGHRPTEKHQLDRINNNDNYTIHNLRWVTPKENCRNTRNNVLLTINEEIKPLSEWSEISNISSGTLLQRYKNNWPESKLLNPIKINQSNKSRSLIKNRLYGIQARCYNTNSINYKNYGERGIKISDLWLNNNKNINFPKMEEDIIKEIGLPSTEKNQLDRINNNGNYEPGNLRWATSIENGRNTRKNMLITINNETKTLSAWAESSKLPSSTISRRFKNKWPEEKLLQPIIKQKFNHDQVEEIINKYINNDISYNEIAKIYNTSERTIMNIIHKRGAYK